MGGCNGLGLEGLQSYKNDVWKTVDGGASWILVTTSAGWTGKKILFQSHSLHIFPLVTEDARIRHRYSVSRVSFAYGLNPPCHDELGSYISDCKRKLVFPLIR